MRRLLQTVLVFLLLPICVEGASEMNDERTQAIDVYRENPFYWQYKGEPVLLLGGSVEDNLFQIEDLPEHLDTLVKAGGNYVRCTMSSRDKGNVWPFARAGQKYDLDQWNPEYWRRFSTFLDETAKRDVIVQIELWATFDYYRDNWDRNPFNPNNNLNYTAEESGLAIQVSTHPTRTENNFFWSMPAENNRETVLHYQQRFVDRIIEFALPRGHVLYCMDNETSVTAEWGAYWANYVQRAARRAGRKIHTTEMWDPHSLKHAMHLATLDHPETYSFADISQNNHQRGEQHYENALWARQRVADSPRPLNNVKVYGADDGRFGGSRDGTERFWRNIFAGCASARFHRPDSGIGLSEQGQRMIHAARQVTDELNIFRCEPRPDLLTRCADNEAFCLAEAGQQYAVYFPAGGEVDLDLSEANGVLELRWYDVDRGGWKDVTEIRAGTSVTLAAPGKGQWTAILR